MNIIQMQNDLKGMSEETLVNIVKNPTGQYPIYLALSEIERQKKMRERYNAIKPEESSIAEKLVGEAEKRTGIAKMVPQRMMPGGQGVGTPPQMDPRQMTPEMLASNGVGALPTKTMEFKEGGIIGYKTGDYLKKAGEFILGRKATKDLPELKNFARRNKFTTAGLASYGGIEGYDAIFGEDGSLDNLPEKGTSEENFNNAIDALNKPKEEAVDKPKLTEKESIAKRVKELQEVIGTDEGRKKIEERLAKKQKDSLNMAGIEFGLGMAGGKSANFLENLTTGAQAGLESYTDTEADIFEIENELAKADRGERMAIIGQALEDGRIDRKLAVQLRAAVIAGPQVSPQAGPAAKRIGDLTAQYDRLYNAKLNAEKNGNTEQVEKINTLLISLRETINSAAQDSVSLSTSPDTYGAGTGATNDPVNIR